MGVFPRGAELEERGPPPPWSARPAATTAVRRRRRGAAAVRRCLLDRSPRRLSHGPPHEPPPYLHRPSTVFLGPLSGAPVHQEAEKQTLVAEHEHGGSLSPDHEPEHDMVLLPTTDAAEA